MPVQHSWENIIPQSHHKLSTNFAFFVNPIKAESFFFFFFFAAATVVADTTTPLPHLRPVSDLYRKNISQAILIG